MTLNGIERDFIANVGALYEAPANVLNVGMEELLWALVATIVLILSRMSSSMGSPDVNSSEDLSARSFQYLTGYISTPSFLCALRGELGSGVDMSR